MNKLANNLISESDLNTRIGNSCLDSFEYYWYWLDSANIHDLRTLEIWYACGVGCQQLERIDRRLPVSQLVVRDFLAFLDVVESRPDRLVDERPVIVQNHGVTKWTTQSGPLVQLC
jgi:hypothetical protein